MSWFEEMERRGEGEGELGGQGRGGEAKEEKELTTSLTASVSTTGSVEVRVRRVKAVARRARSCILRRCRFGGCVADREVEFARGVRGWKLGG
jgi:hypothetical protein